MSDIIMSDKTFEIESEFSPQGDQPAAIKELVKGVQEGKRYQTLLGATGTGKTFTIAQTIAQLQRPTLIIAHNKTPAAQLASEFKDFFRITWLSISSVITIIFSQKHISRPPIRISRRIQVLMKRSTNCGTQRQVRCLSAGTLSL